MINPQQLIEYVIRPTLEHLGMHSDAAENLVLGTALQESGLRHLHQLGGPAVGLWQMEPATHDDIWENYIDYRNNVKSMIRQLSGARYIGTRLQADEMHGNLYYACAMCRIHYYRQPAPLPTADDVEGMAEYWKKYYNTEKGKGRPEQFVEAYRNVYT